MTDKILIELLELIGPGEDDPLVDVGKSVDTLLDEMDALQAEPTWLDYEKIIQDDLMKYIDNPSRPTAMEKMAMLDKLSGDINFYDKWNEDNLFYEEVINTQTEAMPMEKAQEVVDFLFRELGDGDEDEKREFLEDFETNGSIADMARESGTLPAEWDEFATMVEETVGEANAGSELEFVKLRNALLGRRRGNATHIGSNIGGRRRINVWGRGARLGITTRIG